jgi:hypothetical protein
MPPCQDWTEVCINQKLVEVVAKVSGRVFVGPELCNDKDYLDMGSNYTIDLMTAVQALKKLRPLTKAFWAPRLPEVQQLRKREKALSDFLRPIVEERMTAKTKDPNWQEPDDMLQWMINRSNGKESIDRIASFQLGLIFAAIHTTTMTATNILYTLAVTPEYLEPLREEIRNAMAANGGIITSRALQQMEKLDSYMKEVTRFYPPGVSKSSHLSILPIPRRSPTDIFFSHSILQPPRQERYNPLQRAIHPRRRHNRSPLRRHLPRFHTLPVCLLFRRLPLPETACLR